MRRKRMRVASADEQAPVYGPGGSDTKRESPLCDRLDRSIAANHATARFWPT